MQNADFTERRTLEYSGEIHLKNYQRKGETTKKRNEVSSVACCHVIALLQAHGNIIDERVLADRSRALPDRCS